MHWINVIVVALLVVADVFLILELRSARKEMRAIRTSVPAWVGVAIGANLLIAAVNRAQKKAGE